MKSENRLAAFYREVSEKHEKNGDIEKALENLVKAREADDEHRDFYLAEEARLRGMLRDFDPALARELIELLRSEAVRREDFDLYDHAEEQAKDLAVRAARQEAGALERISALRGMTDGSGSGGEAPFSPPEAGGEAHRPADPVRREEGDAWWGAADPELTIRGPAFSGPAELPVRETEPRPGEPRPAPAVSPEYRDVEKIIRDYYNSEVEIWGKELRSEDGEDMWNTMYFAMLTPELAGPFEQAVRNGDLTGITGAVYESLSRKDRNYLSVLDALMEICAEYPCPGDNLGELTWYYNKSLDYLERKRAAGAISEKQYQKLRQSMQRTTPEEIKENEEKAALRSAYRARDLCQYCGGQFVKGLLFEKCGSCGKLRDY